MTYSCRGFKIPDYMMPALQRYIVHGVIPGDFLQAVICNDLKKAVEHADDANLEVLPAYVFYLYNRAPMQCWGSREKMLEWSKARAETPLPT